MKGFTNPAYGETADEIQLLIGADLHFMSPSLTDDGEAFMRILLAADGKVTHYSPEITDAFISRAIEMRPDVVILPGDLTFNGEKQSHLDLAGKLSALTDQGIPVLVIPGNHDLNCSSARAYSGSELFLTDTVSAEEFTEIYRDFGYAEAFGKDTASLSYSFCLNDRILLLMIDVNASPVPGRLSEETLAWVQKELIGANRRGQRVISISHQNLLAHNPIFVDGFVMGGAGQLCDLYREYGVSLNLSGHMHLQHIAGSDGKTDGEDQDIGSEEETFHPLTDIVTSSACVWPCHFGVLSVKDDGWDYHTEEIDIAQWPPGESGSISADGSFLNECLRFFRQCTDAKTAAALEGISLTDTEKEVLTDGISRLNLAYFSGRMDLLNDGEEILAAWQKAAPGSLYTIYLLSVLKGELRNMNIASGSW